MAGTNSRLQKATLRSQHLGDFTQERDAPREAATAPRACSPSPASSKGNKTHTAASVLRKLSVTRKEVFRLLTGLEILTKGLRRLQNSSWGKKKAIEKFILVQKIGTSWPALTQHAFSTDFWETPCIAHGDLETLLSPILSPFLCSPEAKLTQGMGRCINLARVPDKPCGFNLQDWSQLRQI